MTPSPSFETIRNQKSKITFYNYYPVYYTTTSYLPMQTRTLVYANGDRYDGQVITLITGIVVPHGQGTMTYANGDRHTGYYYEGVRHGQGETSNAASQRRYTGGFVYGREEGYATIITFGARGEQRQYIGNVSNNVRHGEGKQYESLSGRTTLFEGRWVNDHLEGQGKFTVTDQNGFTQAHEGFFVNSKLEGYGWYCDSSNGVKRSVLYRAGNVVQWSGGGYY
jgi:hypothetical protein